VLGGDMSPTIRRCIRSGWASPTRIREGPVPRDYPRPSRRGFCKEVVVIFGNHDWRSSAEAMKELAANGLVSVLCHTKAVEIDGLAFLGYSCTPPTAWYVKDFERLDLRAIAALFRGRHLGPPFSKRPPTARRRSTNPRRPSPMTWAA